MQLSLKAFTSGTVIAAAIAVSGVVNSPNPAQAQWQTRIPPAFACVNGSPCDYLYERVNIFMRDPQGYCRRKYGSDAYVRRIWGIPFCALPYDRTKGGWA